MTLCATIEALDAFALLPQCMCGEALMSLLIALINAAAVEESLETSFIGSFVDGQAALRAFEITCCLHISVLICCLRVPLLHFHQLFDGAGPGEFLSHRPVGSKVRLWCLMCQEVAVLLKVLLNDLHSETLVDSGVARVALIATPVWCPLVFVGLPRELALVDESLLVLFGAVARTADWLLVNIMLWVLVDFLQPGSRLFVDLHGWMHVCMSCMSCMSCMVYM